jgi:shikimate dehydrogenase
MANLILSKDTALFISIAQRPSNFGTTLFNTAFQHTKYDAIYKALYVKPGEAKAAVAGIRALGIRGCGVSMPFKKEILPHLDWIDSTAFKIGAVNTIVNQHGRLKGYNTDYYGARVVLQEVVSNSSVSVVLLGDGGVAAALAAALVSLGNRTITVVSRSEKGGRQFVKKWGFAAWQPWRKREQVTGQLLINATSVGMRPQEHIMPVSAKALRDFSIVMDVVLTPMESKLLQEAKRQQKKVMPGYLMSLHQAAKQFELYTGLPAPLSVMQAQIKHVFNT